MRGFVRIITIRITQSAGQQKHTTQKGGGKSPKKRYHLSKISHLSIKMQKLRYNALNGRFLRLCFFIARPFFWFPPTPLT